MRKYLNIDRILLLLTILVGTFLRFYHYGSLPYSFDEFSALSRTYYQTFEDLILKGVVQTDTHPAGIQVFLFYWVKLVGYSEQFVKLPFILAGIVSIYLAYKIADSWFNPTVALLAAMSLAFLQYPITYSEFARPYASGLFFSLLMIWFWYRAFILSDKAKFQDVIAYVLASALCAYNHHFTLFLLGLLWIAGLPLLYKKKWKTYFLSGLAIFILYVPHLKIFFAQLGKGGVEDWLAKPKPVFFLDYLQYIFHFNLLFIVLAGLLIVYSLIWKSNGWRLEMKFRWLLFFIVTITWATAYFYSIYRSALLQYSVLIFTFPLLMILLFSFFKNESSKLKIVLFICFGFLSIYTLIVDRQHYYIMYKSGYREILVQTDSVVKEKGKENIIVLLEQPDHIQKYYLKKLKIDSLDFNTVSEFKSFPDFEDFVSEQTSPYFVLGWNNPQKLEYLSIAQKYYPGVLEHRCYFLSDFYLLARENNNKKVIQEIVYSTKNGEEDIQPRQIANWEEYHKLFEGNLDKLMKHRNNLLEIEIDLAADSICGDNMLVCEFRSGDKLLRWQTAIFKDFQRPGENEFTLFKTLKMPDWKSDAENVTINIYLWNKSHRAFNFKNFQLEVVKGNPLLYGLYEKI